MYAKRENLTICNIQNGPQNRKVSFGGLEIERTSWPDFFLKLGTKNTFTFVPTTQSTYTEQVLFI
jgi:hypothetical protein